MFGCIRNSVKGFERACYRIIGPASACAFPNACLFRIEHPFDVAVQCPQDAHARHHYFVGSAAAFSPLSIFAVTTNKKFPKASANSTALTASATETLWFSFFPCRGPIG